MKAKTYNYNWEKIIARGTMTTDEVTQGKLASGQNSYEGCLARIVMKTSPVLRDAIMAEAEDIDAFIRAESTSIRPPDHDALMVQLAMALCLSYNLQPAEKVPWAEQMKRRLEMLEKLMLSTLIKDQPREIQIGEIPND